MRAARTNELTSQSTRAITAPDDFACAERATAYSSTSTRGGGRRRSLNFGTVRPVDRSQEQPPATSPRLWRAGVRRRLRRHLAPKKTRPSLGSSRSFGSRHGNAHGADFSRTVSQATSEGQGLLRWVGVAWLTTEIRTATSTSLETGVLSDHDGAVWDYWRSRPRGRPPRPTWQARRPPTGLSAAADEHALAAALAALKVLDEKEGLAASWEPMPEDATENRCARLSHVVAAHPIIAHRIIADRLLFGGPKTPPRTLLWRKDARRQRRRASALRSEGSSSPRRPQDASQPPRTRDPRIQDHPRTASSSNRSLLRPHDALGAGIVGGQRPSRLLAAVEATSLN